MLWQRVRKTSCAIWVWAILAAVVWLPRLSGDDSTTKKPAAPPKAVVLDVSPLPDQAAPPKTPPANESRELRLLGPLDAELEELPPLILKPAPAPVILSQPDDDSSSQTDLPRKSQTQPVVPESAPSPQLAVPSQRRDQLVPPAPVSGPAVRYWIVSTRYCRQKQHRCGTACHFVCHAVTDDCQLVSVSTEDVLGSLMPGAPTCVLVHGSFTRLQDVWADAEGSFRWLRGACPTAPLNFIYFTWPSEGIFSLVPNNPLTTPVPCLDFAILGQRAEQNGFYLADLIGGIPPSLPVSLIGHSLGARTISASLHLLAGGTIHRQARWNPADCGNRIRVVVAAAAIDHDWLNPDERYGCALRRAECFLNLRNECDAALALYPLRRPFSSRSLARAGFTRRDQRELGEHVAQVSELDVTPLIGKAHTWPSYTRRPEIAAAVAPYVFFEAAQPVSENETEDTPPRR